MLDRAMAVFLFLVAAGYVHAANGLAFGSLATPKSGFLPLIAGGAALVLTGINVVRSLRAAPTSITVAVDVPRAVATIAVMVAYVALLDAVGFLVTTFFTALGLLKIGRTDGWWRPALIAVATAGGLYFVFGQLLLVPLP